MCSQHCLGGLLLRHVPASPGAEHGSPCSGPMSPPSPPVAPSYSPTSPSYASQFWAPAVDGAPSTVLPSLAGEPVVEQGPVAASQVS